MIKHYGKRVLETILADNKISDTHLDVIYNKLYNSFIEHIDGIGK